ncbi:MAG: PDZ domain-containing protein [Myxococcales bacterium]|nr:PDZ domain-containing protein [Myxococcales bacterium]
MPTLRRVAVIAALVLAWALSGSDRAPLTLTMSDAVAAPKGAALEDNGKSPHDLSSLRVLTKVILYVKDNYVDPKRVRPKEMMVASLEAVEKSVPDVMVDGTADTGKVRVNVNGKLKEFDLSHVDSLWKMSFTLKDVFDFISRNMRPVEDTREIEYAAVNGMLQTLDPHSVLLRPEMYREMKLTTKGEFGGLGFVIQMREGMLTVVKVLPKTPAFRAGIKKDDQIQRIGEESTVNMDLSEAVGKLRGPVDSRVTIHLMRKGWDKPQPMTVTRAMITIESVQSKLLAQGVGYVRLKNFQGNTTRDLQSALLELSQQATEAGNKGLKGLVLDLRGNPGGLLDQAIQVSDLFLSSGTIVATVGLSDKLREEKRAHADDEDDAFPVAVLVNAGSASASEIVAGALKNQNRAVIIGRQTFGKGSVQVLYDFPDDSALKLTIAKYLTPGDLSIQEVGITPDIELIPTRVTQERVDLFAPRRSMGEADLEHHFSNPANSQAAKKREDVVVREHPVESLKFLKDEPQKVAKAGDPKKDPKAAKGGGKNPLTDSEALPESEELDDQLDAESQDEVKEDFEVTFAREFLLAAPKLRRDEMLKAGKGFVASRRTSEEKRIADAIGALGVDWTPGASPKTAQLVASLKASGEKKITAGEAATLELTVENKGAEPVRRLRAWIEADNGIIDRREFLFGLVKPGEKKSWSVKVKTPKDLLSRRDGVKVKLQDDSGVLSETEAGELNFVELPRPQFSFTWSINDTCAACNGDGLIQRGEDVTLVVDVTNVGTGKALDTFSSIRNASDSNIFIEKGRFKLGELGPGETKSARFQLEVKKAYKNGDFGLKLAIIDEPLEEFTTDKLDLPVAPDGPALTFEPRKGSTVRIADKADVYAAGDGKRVLARLPKGATLVEQARGATFSRLEWDKDRFVFVKTSDLRDAKGQKAAAPKDVSWSSFRAPAQITFNVDPAAGGAVVEGERFTLSSVVADPKLLDLFVLVNDQKVFFKGKGEEDGDKVKFTTEFPLKEGNNLVTVIARQTQDFSTRKTIVVRRRPAAAVAQSGADPRPAGP